MFSAVLFAQDQMAARSIEQAATASKQVCIYRTMLMLSSPYELTKILNSYKPDIVFVDMCQFENALALARKVHAHSPEATVIGFAQAWDEEHARLAREAGVPEILPMPVSDQQFQHGVDQAVRKSQPAVQEKLLAFLPSKAGSGATTIALHTAGSLARDLEQKVLLMEGDLRSGLISLLLKISPERSILDALDMTTSMDGAWWNSIVTRAQGLDILPTLRPTEQVVISWASYHQLLQFVQARYDTIVVDLPEVVNDATLEIVRRARRVFVVTTAELPPLVLARQRRLELKSRGIPDARIGVILNRWTKNEIQVKDVEEFLEAPISAVFQNDYHCVRRATQDGRLIGTRSELGRTISSFAANLVRQTEPAAQPKSNVNFLDSLLSRKACAAR